MQEQYGNNRAKHRPTVVKIEGLRLAFLRRWTLCSSMLYNHHVATRFQTWREVGVVGSGELGCMEDRLGGLGSRMQSLLRIDQHR
jgi:hypothetical protein